MKQRFLELIHEGVSIRGTSRIVGINRRTGQERITGRGERVRTRKPGRKAVRTAVQPLVGTRCQSLLREAPAPPPERTRRGGAGRKRSITATDARCASPGL
ncbi:hypothetical protein GCM10020367_39430 [Streptomyces sannanensis]|uniref:Transposase n=1 Tax=Streptomyces sannanensis TaxID=285536 RepID=A0ABP6SE86_9ACTN